MSKELGTGADEAINKIAALDVEINKLRESLVGLKEGSSEYLSVQSKLNAKMEEASSSVKKDTDATDDNTGAKDKNTDAANENASAHENSTFAIQSKINALVKEMRTMDISSKAYKQKALEVNKLSASMHQGRTATGLATTSAMEFGRVVSDAPYGIRGMANNVSQLTSLLFQGSLAIDEATGKAIGFSGAIKGVWKAMMGPLGIMIAIQAVIAILDGFSGSTKKAEKELAKFTDQMVDTSAKTAILNAELDTYLSVIVNSKKDTAEYANALVELKKKGLDPASMSTEQLVLAIEKLKDEQEEIAILKNKQKVYKEDADAYTTLLNATLLEEADIRIRMAKNEKDLRDSKVDEESAAMSLNSLVLKQELEDNLAKNEEYNKKKTKALEDYKANELRILKVGTVEEKRELGRLEVLEGELEVLEEQQLQISQTEQQYADYGDLVIAKQKEIDDFKRKVDKPKEATEVKDFSLSQSKIESILRKSLQKQTLLRSENDKDRLLIKNQNQEEDLLNTYNLEREKNKIKLDAYLNSKASPAQKAEAQRIYDENEINATKLHEAALESIHNEGSLREAKFDKDLKDKLREGQLKAELDSLDSHLDVVSQLLNDKDPKSLEVLQEKQRAVWEKEDELFEQDLVRTAEKMDKEGANALEIEDKINELKFEQSQNRAAAELQLEVDTIEAKKSVQQEYFSYLSGLGSVLTELGKKNKALAIAGLAMEKGAAIANIVIEASKSNATQTAADAVFASVTNAKYAAVPVGGQALAASEILANQAVSAKLRAKTNIRAGLSIAKIAATTITSGSLGSGSGGGGSATGSSATVSPSFAPNFNVVGNSNENQLAQSISNQTNSPVQAYVVYEDIAEAESVTQQSIESSGI